jgi:hypothetical protein
LIRSPSIYCILALSLSACGSKKTVEVLPARDSQAVRTVVRENLKQVRDCYESELKKVSELEGKVVLAWDIQQDGTVGDCDVLENSIDKGDGLAQCLITRVKSWKFQKHSEGKVARVRYPFIFSAKPPTATD